MLDSKKEIIAGKPYEDADNYIFILYQKGYIKGVVLSWGLQSVFRHIAEPIKPQITIKEAEYLTNN